MKKLYRWRRYLFFAIEYYLYEKPRGLDFTMRDLEPAKNGDISSHGYSKTYEKHLKAIFEKLPLLEELNLLDVGCGKGVVLKEAAKYPFRKIEGIDINDKLIQTASRNFKKLRLDQRVKCEEKNALEYEEYGNFNVFFFFNPFDREVFEAVVDKILQATKNKQKHIYFIYHNPVFAEVLEERRIFTLQYKLYDSMKQYDTYIYEVIF